MLIIAAPVVCEMTLDEVTSCQSREEREFPRKNCRTHHTGQLGGVSPRILFVGPPEAHHAETGPLWGENGPSTHSAQLYGGHGTGDVQVLSCWPTLLHQSHAVGARDILRWVLHKHEQSVHSYYYAHLQVTVHEVRNVAAGLGINSTVHCSEHIN